MSFCISTAWIPLQPQVLFRGLWNKVIWLTHRQKVFNIPLFYLELCIRSAKVYFRNFTHGCIQIEKYITTDTEISFKLVSVPKICYKLQSVCQFWTGVALITDTIHRVCKSSPVVSVSSFKEQHSTFDSASVFLIPALISTLLMDRSLITADYCQLLWICDPHPSLLRVFFEVMLERYHDWKVNWKSNMAFWWWWCCCCFNCDIILCFYSECKF